MATAIPASITLTGRLSWPVLTMAAANERNPKSKFPKADKDVAPEYNLVLEQKAVDKLTNFLLTEFIPALRAAFKSGDAKYAAFDDKTVDKLQKAIEVGDWEDQPPYLFIKPVPEKTLAMAPEGVAMIKVSGDRGRDIIQKAVVRGEDELAIPDNDVLDYPVVKPINETVHELYAGCVAGTTLNIYAYISGKLPGLGAGGATLAFKANADAFGGSAGLDEDALFLDD